MIAAFSFAPACHRLQFPVHDERTVTFGHWPQVSDSVWLIATVVMRRASPHLRQHLLVTEKAALRAFGKLGPPSAFIHGEDFPTH
jgi:hypothetical protein